LSLEERRKGAEIDMLNDKREELDNKTTCPSDQWSAGSWMGRDDFTSISIRVDSPNSVSAAQIQQNIRNVLVLIKPASYTYHHRGRAQTPYIV
jgi:hypothetical protein